MHTRRRRRRPAPVRRRLRTALRAAAFLVAAAVPMAGAAQSQPPPVCAGKALRPAAVSTLSSKGRVRALVLFARFADESGPATVPAWSRDLFAADLPGSLTHFFDEMSAGQFRLDGHVHPTVYSSPEPAAAYLATTGTQGGFGRFTRAILAAADADIDFGAFDNDGRDGVPNSGDDDGFVDLLFVITQSAPTGFIAGDADGIARLGLDVSYRTADEAVEGGVIAVAADSDAGGTLQRGRSLADAAGIIAHELGHLFGLPDLYDRDATELAAGSEFINHSAGIGYWGLMAHGARGWDDRGGPTPFCAWSLRRLGWLGVNNERLVPVTRSIDGAVLADVNQGGRVYQLPISDDQYLLVEHRSAAASYYERHLPADGVLIWHVRSDRGHNDEERAKLVDLVCADGLYADAGFPRGREPSPTRGQDNLDYWSRDAGYAETHAGNLGDATDVYDGVTYTEYSPLTNPALNRVNVNRIRRTGAGFVADLTLTDPRRAGVVDGTAWRDTILVVGDLVVEPEVRLVIEPRAVIRFAADALGGGADPARTELVVHGSMTAAGADEVLFTSAAADPAPGDWGGIQVTPSGRLELSRATVEYATDGVRIRDARRDQELARVTVRRVSGTGLHLESVSGGVRLAHVQVLDAGGDGLLLQGGALVTASGLVVRDNGGSGLVRTDGALRLTDSELAGNARAGADHVDLAIDQGGWGTVSGNRLAGTGVGARFRRSEATALESNTFAGYRLAMRTLSASPRILGNTFSDVDTVLAVEGFPVPVSMLLNVVVDARALVVNSTAQRLEAARNWWGTAEASLIQAGMTGPVDWEPSLNFDPRRPVAFQLAQNYPNPFNADTAIEFTIPVLEASLGASGPMRLEVRTVTGALVNRLLDQEAAPGVFHVTWDGRDQAGRRVASGVYYYELSVGGLYLRKRLALVR